MKLLSRTAWLFVFLAAATCLFAAAAPPRAVVPPEPLPQPAPPPAPPVSSLKFNDYIKDLAAALKLTDDEKKAVASFYQADGARLKAILGSDSIPPLEQDRQVSELRAARNAKIATLLSSSDRVSAFLRIEARYRVALIELASAGGLESPAAAASPAEPASAPSPASVPAVSAKTPPPM